jgi:multicomponent Na+:H+ antiporter subunit C
MMLYLLAFVIGGLYAVALYLMLRRNIVQLIFGLLILGPATNLLIFTVGGLVRARAPIVPDGATAPPPGVADPLPQALVLTAIVIGFALTAFAAVLVKRVYMVTGTDDSDELRSTDT